MDLFHISFVKRSSSRWQPKPPDGSVDSPVYDPSGPYPEPLTPRICVSETLAGCFYAVYPNVSQYFEHKHFPHMDFFYYCPVLDAQSKVWTPEHLTEKRLVWDAHVTREHAILTPTIMQLRGKVRFFNTSKDAWVTTHPFDDQREPVKEIAPKASYRILQTFGSIANEGYPVSRQW